MRSLRAAPRKLKVLEKGFSTLPIRSSSSCVDKDLDLHVDLNLPRSIKCVSGEIRILFMQPRADAVGA